jgi:hypothetical protein
MKLGFSLLIRSYPRAVRPLPVMWRWCTQIPSGDSSSCHVMSCAELPTCCVAHWELSPCTSFFLMSDGEQQQAGHEPCYACVILAILSHPRT